MRINKLLLAAGLSTVAMFSATSSVSAQRLIGYAGNNASSLILRQNICNTPFTVCTNAMAVLPDPFSGGLAFDPQRESVWHTQGTRLQELLVGNASGAQCRIPCTTGALRVLGGNSVVGGLTLDRERRILYQVESVPGAAAISRYRLNGATPCPTGVFQCRFQIPDTARTGAIALLRDPRLLVVSVTDSSPIAVNNILFVFRQDDPSCTPICRVEVPPCPNGGLLRAIRAMTYDVGNSTLLLSDGRQTLVARLIQLSTGCFALRPVSCCPTNAPNGELYHGLDLDGPAPRRLGTPCFSRPCTPCPNMTHTATGIPLLGNPTYSLDIDRGPDNSLAFMVFAFGGGVPQPFGCGTLFPNIGGSIFLGPQFLVPAPLSNGCTGSTSFPLPIPLAPPLTGTIFTTQGLLVCPAGGISLTNGLVHVISS